MLAQANRVRQLIGDIHWLSDGFHKETLLRGLLERHLPAGVACARGFVFDPENGISREQDILVLDETRMAPLFRSGELAIVFPECVLAAISVKTKSGRTEILDSLDGLRSVFRLCTDIWTGVYCFDSSPLPANAETVYKRLADGLKDGSGARLQYSLDMLATMENLVVRSHLAADEITIRGFNVNGHATAFFVGSLLAHIERRRGFGTTRFADFLNETKTARLEPAVYSLDRSQNVRQPTAHSMEDE